MLVTQLNKQLLEEVVVGLSIKDFFARHVGGTDTVSPKQLL